MQLIDAIQIVLDLARENVIDPTFDKALEKERERQLEAINTVKDFAVNQLGDD